MAHFDPPAELLNQTGMLLYVLRDPTSPQYGEAQRHLESQGTDSNFLLCLAYILARARDQVTEDVRQLAGLLLKNYVIRNRAAFFAAGKDFQDYIKLQALIAARDTNEGVRNIASIVITTVATDIVRAGTSLGSGWPGLFQSLIEMLRSGDVQAIEGAFSTSIKILEDTGTDLKIDQYGQQVLNELVTTIPTFFSCENHKVRAYAVRAMNLMVPLKPTQLTVNMEGFIQGLAMLKDDVSPWVRQGVCQALVALFRDGSDHVLAKLPEIMEFMLAKSQDPAEDVAREACEFWNIFCCEYDDDRHHTRQVLDMLRAFLPRLVPVLLTGMAYSKSDREVLEGENKLEMDNVPDKLEDIRPRHFHSRSGVGAEEQDDHDDDSDEDAADDLGGGEVEQWNLRKCAAATLDTLAEFFGPDAILPVLLPLVYDRLDRGDVWEREAAILAIGAVASCVKGLSEHLPRLFPYLLRQLDPYLRRGGEGVGESNPQLACTVVWTLGRYGRWVLYQQNDPTYLAPLVERLLHVMLDRNKKVQQAACSSFATLEEEAGQRLLPYLSHILPFMAEAMDRYQTRSLIVLFDTLGTLADSVATDLAKPEHINIFMPKLYVKWKSLDDHDRVLLYLLECFTSIAQSLGVQFQPWAMEVYERCLGLIRQTMVASQQQQAGAGHEVDMDFAVCALDLLTGMAEGLGPSFESLIPRSELLSLLFACMQAPSDEVRQSAFALVGDLAKTCHHQLMAVLQSYMPVLIDNLNPASLSVCNNASWAIGEITVKVGGDVMAPFVAPIMGNLVPIINNHEINRNLLENTAITIGRLAKVCPAGVAPSVGVFLHAWCMNLQEVKHRGEKEHAFEGLCMTLQQNPMVLLDGGINTFEAFAWAVASWFNPDVGFPDPPEGLNHMFRAILHYIRDVVKSHRDWNEFMKELDPQLISYLISFYEL